MVRFYNINGTNYPSVTTVLGIRKTEQLKEWRQKIGENVAIGKWEDAAVEVNLFIH